jgi:N-acetylmuramoyl-L-alanine amidase
MMKKAIIFVCAALLLAVQLPVFAAPKQYVVLYQETNFRSSNSVNSQKITTLKPPAKLEILETSKNADGETWFKVKLSDGKFAWVSAAVVKVDTINDEVSVSNQSLVLDASINKINIRSNPTRNSEIVKTINVKATYRIISKVTASDGSIWYKINLGENKQGWVLSSVVSNFITDSVKKETVSDRIAIIESQVNIRTGPSLESALVTRTTSTIRPQILSQAKDKQGFIWYEVLLPNKQPGWVRSDFVTIQKPVTEIQQKGMQVTIDTGTNIRSDAGTDFKAVFKTVKTITLPVLASKPDVNGDVWYKIQADFGVGWVKHSVVTVSSTLSYPTVTPQSYLRVSPSKSAKSVTYTDKQFRCNVSGSAITRQNEKWFLVTLVEVNKTGWVIGDSVKLVSSVKFPPTNMIGTTVEVKKETKLTEIPAGNTGTTIYSGGKGTVDAVAIRDQGQLYCRIVSGGNVGWLSTDFLRKSQSASVEPASLSALQYEIINEMTVFKIPYKGTLGQIKIIEIPNESNVKLIIENALLTFSNTEFLKVNSTLIERVSSKQVSSSPAIVNLQFETNKPVQTYFEATGSGLGEIIFKAFPRSSDSDIKVMIQGKPVMSRILPYIKDNKPMVPLAGIKETLSYLIQEYPEKKEYHLVMPDDRSLIFRIGDPQVTKMVGNIKNVFMVKPAPELKNDNLYVPIDQIASTLGFKYQFVGISRTIYLDPVISEIRFGECADKQAECSTMPSPVSFMPKIKQEVDADGKVRIIIPEAVLDPAGVPKQQTDKIKVSSIARNGNNPPSITLLIKVADNESVSMSESKNPYRLTLSIKKKNVAGLSGKTVYLDPGHGSFFNLKNQNSLDVGCKSKDGLTESKLALDVMLKLSSMLKAEGANVMMTRIDEKSASSKDLDTRISNANDSGADLFISLHFGNSLDEYENGCKTYYYSKGEKFAKILQNRMTRAVPGDDMGSRLMGFDVCKNISSMASVLIEPMYLSNEKACNWISDQENVDRMAQALLDAIKEFFEE